MKVTGVELRTIKAPLVSPFRTSFGTETVREALLVRVVTDEAEGWGECGAGTAPQYSSQYTHAAADVLSRFLVPALAGVADLDAHQVAPALAAFKGHRMAKVALETAVLDADLRARGVPSHTPSARSATECRAGCRWGSRSRSPRFSTPSPDIWTPAICGSS